MAEWLECPVWAMREKACICAQFFVGLSVGKQGIGGTPQSLDSDI